MSDISLTENISEINYIKHFKVKVCNESLSSTGSFTHGGDFERESVGLIYESLVNKRNPVFVDVGANAGSYSLLPVMIPDLQVHSFEPVPDNCEMLRKNVELNHIKDNVVLNCIALGDKKQRVMMHYEKSCHGHSKINDGDGENHIAVDVTTLDDYVKKNKIMRIDYLKIDTEGYDYYVLKGAECSLLRFSPPIIIEMDSRMGFSMADYDAYFDTLGYKRIKHVDGGYLCERSI